jgi:hypothetical protein
MLAVAKLMEWRDRGVFVDVELDIIAQRFAASHESTHDTPTVPY